MTKSDLVVFYNFYTFCTTFFWLYRYLLMKKCRQRRLDVCPFVRSVLPWWLLCFSLKIEERHWSFIISSWYFSFFFVVVEVGTFVVCSVSFLINMLPFIMIIKYTCTCFVNLKKCLNIHFFAFVSLAVATRYGDMEREWERRINCYGDKIINNKKCKF